eukprot:scaffold370_cov289-Prasinococcus_capsulatus_cf.AAC.17
MTTTTTTTTTTASGRCAWTNGRRAGGRARAGTHSGTLANLIPATGKLVDTPPQACSMKFNEEGLCTQLTIGYRPPHAPRTPIMPRLSSSLLIVSSSSSLLLILSSSSLLVLPSLLILSSSSGAAGAGT